MPLSAVIMHSLPERNLVLRIVLLWVFDVKFLISSAICMARWTEDVGLSLSRYFSAGFDLNPKPNSR
jgi:hypothetical protein